MRIDAGGTKQQGRTGDGKSFTAETRDGRRIMATACGRETREDTCSSTSATIPAHELYSVARFTCPLTFAAGEECSSSTPSPISNRNAVTAAVGWKPKREPSQKRKAVTATDEARRTWAS